MAVEYLLQEDGASLLLLEDGSGALLLESSGAAAGGAGPYSFHAPNFVALFGPGGAIFAFGGQGFVAAATQPVPTASMVLYRRRRRGLPRY